jgi:hypothetical protein
MSSGCSSGEPSSGDSRTVLLFGHAPPSRVNIMFHVHLPCSLLWHLGWSWTWGRAGSSPVVSTELKLLQHSWLIPISTNAFREKPFVRSFVRPSIRLHKIARFCNFPRSCSIYKPCFSTTRCQCALLSFTKRCLLLPSLAGPLNQVVHARPTADSPPATATATARGCRMSDARRSQIERRAPRLARCQPSSRGTSN